MRFITAAFAVGVASVAAAASAPFKGFPLSNGFPSPKPAAIAKIQQNAGGPLPDGALPTKLSKTATATFQLLGLQEIFEVAYFSSLLKNVTNDEPGFKTKDKKYLMRSLRRIRAQEELHAIGINAILANAGEKTVGGCKYVFPTTSVLEALSLASTFTDVVLGVLPAVQAFAATDPDITAVIPLVGSILAQEGEQVGYFRSYQNKVPSSAPFLTGGAAQFAYSALRMFLVPGSCSTLPDIPFFKPITIDTPPRAANSVITMSVEGIVKMNQKVAYISGQHSPFVVPIQSVQTKNGKSTFKAKFPYSSGIAKGLTIAAVIKDGEMDPASAAEVAAAAVYGPGLIEVG